MGERSRMKLLSFALLGLSLANDESEEKKPDYSDDLRYTRCQAVHLQALSGITVPESHITEDEPGFVCPDPEADSGDADAWQNGVRKWDQNFNEASDRWEVGYFYESESDSAKVSTIDKKLQEFKSMTCIDFKKVSKNDSKYAKKIKIVFSGGCASYVGSHYAEQTLWLGPRCENSYIPLHEAMHAVGFWHEHQRGDRNNHVQINKNACSMTGSSFDVNFENTHFNWGNTGHAYDFGSIMHYDPFACAKSRNNPVITYPGTNDPVKLTKTSTFSDLDIAQINKMYPCDANPVTTTQKPTTKPTPKPTTTAATTTTAEPDTCTQERVRPPTGRDTCVDFNSISNLNMKVLKDGYSNGQNPGSFASVRCKPGYQLNMFNKEKTKATCMCSGSKCNWKFSKGDVMCVKCEKEILQGKDGRAVTVVNKWDSGIAIMWRIKPYKVSDDGWSVGLDMKTPLESDSVSVTSNALDLTGQSMQNQYFTFTPKESSNIWDGTQGNMVNMMVAFEFEGASSAVKRDIQKVEKVSNYYYKGPSGDQSCMVDRFECYPL